MDIPDGDLVAQATAVYEATVQEVETACARVQQAELEAKRARLAYDTATARMHAARRALLSTPGNRAEMPMTGFHRR